MRRPRLASQLAQARSPHLEACNRPVHGTVQCYPCPLACLVYMSVLATLITPTYNIICICICMCVYLYIYIIVHTHSTCIYTSLSLSLSIYIYIYITNVYLSLYTYIYIYIYIHIERERERERERDDTSLVPVWGCICSSSVAPFAGPARWDLAQAAKRQVRSQDIYIYIYSYRYMYVYIYI